MEKVFVLLCLSFALLFAGCEKEETETRVSENPATFGEKEIIDGLWCDYYYLLDPDTGQVFCDVGSSEKLYPASLTKLMTAILALEKIEDLETTIIPFTAEMKSVLQYSGLSRAGFDTGDEPTALDYLYACLLPSGADGTLGLATYISGSEEAFTELMNEKAKELGMNDTHFANASGDDDEENYSTCQDMMKLYLYCMQNEQFMEILSSPIYTSTPLKSSPDGLGMLNFVLCYINRYEPEFDYNYSIPGFIAGKSGFTNIAQYTLACNAEINGMNLVLVNAHGYDVAHHPVEIEDASTLFNWYNDYYERKTVVEEGELFATVKVGNTFFQKVSIVAKESIEGDLPVDENCHIVFTVQDDITAPVEEGQVLGRLTVYDYNQVYKTIDLVAQNDVKENWLLSFFVQ